MTDTLIETIPRAMAEEDPIFAECLTGEEMRDLARAALSAIKEAGHVIVPREPCAETIDSMALRYRHDFGLLSDSEQASIRVQMCQLHETMIDAARREGE